MNHCRAGFYVGNKRNDKIIAAPFFEFDSVIVYLSKNKKDWYKGGKQLGFFYTE